MDLADEQQRAAWCDYLGEIFTDRRVICGVEPLAGFVDWVALLRAAGARKPLILATGQGAGPVPGVDEASVVFLDVPVSESITEEVRGQDALVRDLPDDVRRRIEEYDGRGDAFWLVGPFVANEPILGREVVGGRPRAWTALEDKLLADAVWAAVGLPHEAHETVVCEPDALRVAAEKLDAGAGTVWSGDARDGFNGAGDFVRWVCTDDDAAAAYEFFSLRCDRVRVMPFLDGVPCSIHGIVLPDGTAAFRPVELAILRGAERRFVYGGQGTAWSPPDVDREEMRELVRRTGEQLRDVHGYRGCFGIDGVLTADGFRPTELNPRMPGGFSAMAHVVDPRAFSLLQFNLVLGRDPRVRVEELEAWALTAMDGQLFLKPIAISPLHVVSEPVDISVGWDGATLMRCEEDRGWSVSVASNPSGTYAKLTVPNATVAGQRTAGLNVALMQFLDAELGTSFGEVHAAPDVRKPLAH
jgi:hypothetical protein